MKKVYLNPDAETSLEDVYFMYRNVKLPEHEELITKARVSYDITVIPAGKIGKEFNKTIGHYHAIKPGTTIAYPEVYEVISGCALFFLQKMDSLFEKLEDVIVIEAGQGEKVVYPPNYGHIIVNIGGETLVTSNWVGNNFERLYEPISDHMGMGYYVVESGEHGYSFVANDNYENHPKVKTLKNNLKTLFPIAGDAPMYTTGVSQPETLEFLVEPDKYADTLEKLIK